MKKSTLQTIASYINAHNIAELANVYDEIVAELSKGAEKAQANRDLYEQAHEVVIAALANVTAPVTIGELFDEVARRLHQGQGSVRRNPPVGGRDRQDRRQGQHLLPEGVSLPTAHPIQGWALLYPNALLH